MPARAPAGSDGLYWLPYLMGERTPHLDAAARGGWIGLTARHTRADLIRALLEGVSYSLKDCLDLIEQLGIARSVRVSGGGAHSRFWRQVLADAFSKPVVSLETQEGSAYGAALLALAGTGEYSSVPEVCQAVVRRSIPSHRSRPRRRFTPPAIRFINLCIRRCGPSTLERLHDLLRRQPAGASRSELHLPVSRDTEASRHRAAACWSLRARKLTG